MVAMAISLALMLAMLELTAQAGRGFGRTQRSIHMQGEGRGALHFMAEDMATRMAGTPVLISSDGGAAWPCGMIGFYRTKSSAEPADALGGDVVFVLYEVKSVIEAGGISRQLVRSVWDSGEAFGALKARRTPLGAPSSEELLALQVVGFALAFPSNAAGEPASCEIVLSVVDDLAAARLKTEPDWRAATAHGAALIGARRTAPPAANVNSYQTIILLEP
jgi:hypothetical protein